MKNVHRRSLAAALALSLLISLPVRAADFRIVSHVFVGDDEQAASTNTTLFRAGLVYDYLAEPPSVTIFDPLRGRFVLIDPAHQLQAQMSIQEVAKFSEELKMRASAHSNSLLKFMALPKFEVGGRGNQLVMTSPQMTYELHTLKVKDRTALQEYFDFSNWYARLNTMVNPGSPPPFARIEINKTMEKRGVIPNEVELRISAGAGKERREVKLRSRHDVTWKLLGEDLRRIDETSKQLATFKNVSFEQFYQAGIPRDEKTAEKPTQQQARK